MNASQLEVEQKMFDRIANEHLTMQRLIHERNAYRDALEKIQAIRFKPMTFEEKFDNIMLIVEATLNNFK